MAVQQFLMMGRAAAGRSIITGQYWVWGKNDNGNNGTGNTTNTSVPLQLGTDTDFQNTLSPGAVQSTRVIVRSDGTLWSWGLNTNGQLGNGTKNAGTSSPVQVGTDTDWLEGGCFGSQSGAVKTDGTLWLWGFNGLGTIAQGNVNDVYSSPVQAGTDTDWAHLLMQPGGSLAVAMKTDGSIYASGYLDSVGATRLSNMAQLGDQDGFVDAVLCGSSAVFWKEA
tara:strand:- start:803 stop:1471 length:669 start_codon:yes stop_codon:yes gene_type:complete